jgi:hypothetical protein
VVDSKFLRSQDIVRWLVVSIAEMTNCHRRDDEL